MSDKLVFDLASEVEGSPSVFVRKDWLNILDNQNQNYNNNQSIVDTSQLSNSNKYMSYREAYLSIPFLISLGTTEYSAGTTGLAVPLTPFTPGTAATSADYTIGLKNWFGQIIHSFTLDYNGTTIVQQTPYINMWNSFKLMTSLSLDDVNTQGATIGFYPDDALSWQFSPPVLTGLGIYGQGTCNNTNYKPVNVVSGVFNNFESGQGNSGYIKRQELINFDGKGVVSASTGAPTADTVSYANLIFGSTDYSAGAITGNNPTSLGTILWKSYISNRVNQTGLTASTGGLIQYTVVATVYLKHIHSFFNMCPLLKGVFMKMTLNLNNTTTTLQAVASAGGAVAVSSVTALCSSVSNPLGGVNPLMFASCSTNNGSSSMNFFPTGVATGAGTCARTYRMNISVGGTCLDSVISSITGYTGGTASKSVYLYIPAYTFNPVFEQAYLSSPVKQIKYTDVYQYQVLNVAAGGVFNNLLTNGIANVKSILVLPFYSSIAGTNASVTNNVSLNSNTGFLTGTPVWQSPFDPAGTGTTSPLCYLSNFNVQVSGQNAIYNTQKYNFEQFNNQLYGQNAVNGGLTDGITSGLIDRQKFDMCYSYYYVNVERMLPVEMSVPKSIQIIGQNYSSKALDLYCFIEYGVEVSIDALTGARV